MNKKEKRLYEAEVEEAETLRAKAVVLTKLAHGLIERIERERKRKNAVSVIRRIEAHAADIGSIMDIINIDEASNHLMEGEDELISNLIQTYKSIREDFRKVTKMKEEDFLKMFPERPTYFETRLKAIFVLLGIIEQESQMVQFLSRYL